MKKPEMEDRYWSIGEACAYLGVSSESIYKWIEKQNFPAHRIGRLWKFKKDEIDEWVRSGDATEKE